MTTETDQRYTAEALAAMATDELYNHAEGRQVQLAGARAGYERAGRALDFARTDEEIDEASHERAQLRREIVEQEGWLTKLQAEIDRRYMLTGASSEMTDRDIAWIEQHLFETGLPGFEADDEDTRQISARLWWHAYLGLDAISDQPFNRRAVAKRAAGAWMALYIPADDLEDEDYVDTSQPDDEQGRGDLENGPSADDQ